MKVIIRIYNSNFVQLKIFILCVVVYRNYLRVNRSMLSNEIFHKNFNFLACELKNPTMNQYLNALDSSSWLQHIKSVLDAAILIARVIKKSF